MHPNCRSPPVVHLRAIVVCAAYQRMDRGATVRFDSVRQPAAFHRRRLEHRRVCCWPRYDDRSRRVSVTKAPRHPDLDSALPARHAACVPQINRCRRSSAVHPLRRCSGPVTAPSPSRNSNAGVTGDRKQDDWCGCQKLVASVALLQDENASVAPNSMQGVTRQCVDDSFAEESRHVVRATVDSRVIGSRTAVQVIMPQLFRW
jgi:hypothetical protein